MAESPRQDVSLKIYHSLFSCVVVLFGTLLFSMTLSAKEQHKKTRQTNNMTNFTFKPELPKSLPMLAMRHVPAIMEGKGVSLNLERAREIARIAKETVPYKRSKGMCLRWVRQFLSKQLYGIEGKRVTKHILDFYSLPNDPKPPVSKSLAKSGKSKKVKVHPPGRSAEDFKKWALDNPISLCEKLKLANATPFADDAPQTGFLHIYGAGKCGIFHKSYGHIEVVTDAKKGEACSDHCRSIQTKQCSPDLILAPVRDCDFLKQSPKMASHKTPLILSRLVPKK